MEVIDLDEVLPKHLRIDSIDDTLYDIGLSLTSLKDEPKKRRFIDHPLLIFLCLIIELMRSIVCIFSKNKLLLVAFGDYGHVFGIQVTLHMNIIKALICTLCILSQLVYYYNYKKGVHPTFLRLFQMLAGTISPINMGISDESDLIYLVKISKKYFKLVKLNNEKYGNILGFIFSILHYLIFKNILQILIYGIYNTFILGLLTHHFFNIAFYQFFYFHILCKYICIKLNNLNKNLNSMKKGMHFMNIQNIVRSFNSLHLEINDYNITYWSKFLSIVWLTYGTAITFYLYFVFFARLPLIFNLIVIYPLTLTIFTFLFTLLTAASVNSESYKSYKLLNSLLVSYRLPNRHQHSFRHKKKDIIKVNKYINMD